MNLKRELWLIAASGLAICMGTSATAQDTSKASGQSASPKDDNTVVVVTANKRKERLFDVAETVNVVTGTQVTQLNLTKFEDIDKVTPGLDITRGAGQDFSVSLRGVRFDPDTGANPTVDLYMNEVPVALSTMIQGMYDVGSVQVLRGPQGTLRGGTGPSGAILLGTHPADLDSSNGEVEISGTDSKDETVRGAYGLPLIDGKLAVRIAGYYDHNDGYDVRSLYNDVPDHGQTSSGRASVSWAPLDTVHVDAMFQSLMSSTILNQAIEGSGVWGTFTPQDRTSLVNLPSTTVQHTNILTLNATWDVGENRLSYVGGYQANKNVTDRDVDTEHSLSLLDPGAADFQGLDFKGTTVSNELRLERTGDHFWTYRFGAYNSLDRTGGGSLIDLTGANGNCQTSPGPLAAYGLPCIVLGAGSEHTVTTGYFTTQTFKLTPSDVAEVGLRESDIHNSSGIYKALTGSANYKHYFSPNLMVYANYGTSFRPGQADSIEANYSPWLPASTFATKSETSRGQEFGFKTEFMSHRFSLTTSVYRQKFENYIYRGNDFVCSGNPTAPGPTATTTYATKDGLPDNGTNTCQVSLNGNGNAIAQGAEFEFRARITQGWQLQLDGTQVDSHFENAIIYCNDYNGDGVPDSVGTPAVQAGKYVSLCKSNGPIANLPKWTLTASSSYEFSLSAGWNGFVRGLATIKPMSTDPFTSLTTEKSEIIDLFIGGQQLNSGLELSVFVKNLLNDQYITQNLAGLVYTNVIIANGRRIGVELRKSF